MIYMKGEDGPRDEKEALKWWKEASKSGHAAATTSIGRCYEV